MIEVAMLWTRTWARTLLLVVGVAAQTLQPTGLRVDHIPPSGSAGVPIAIIHSTAPSFSWVLNHGRRGATQAAYRLLLNATWAGAAPTVVWDTGIIISNQSVGVQYGRAAAPLASDADYAWTVAWRDERGAWSAPSAPARFSTGLLAARNADWAGTAWVGGLLDGDDRNQLRRTFALPAASASVAQVWRARCYVSAPGCHETHLNGVRLQASAAEGVERAALGPTVQFSSRLPYQAFDCTAALRAGGSENVIATTLGRCWYAMPDYPGLGYKTIGARSLRVLITAVLGPASPAHAPTRRWATNTTQWRLGGDGAGWRHARGPLTSDHLFLGNALDGRRETPGWRGAGFDDAAWEDVPVLHGHGPRAAPAAPAPAPALLALAGATPPLVALQLPPVRQLAPRAPVTVAVTAPGVALLDFGTNMAGTCEIVVDDTSAARPGDVMRVRHAEGLDATGALDQTWLTGQRENSSYTFRADGTRETYTERFTYFGFRFLEIAGFPGAAAPPTGAVTCFFSHTDLGRTSTINFIAAPGANASAASAGTGTNAAAGGFATMLARLQAAIVQSALSNFQSHPTDCPSREKRGWTGDGGHAAETLMLNFDMGAPHAKWLQDIDDAACGEHHVPNIAPGNFHSQALGACFGEGDPGWGAGFVDVLGWHYRYHGDRAVLARHFAAAEGYVALLSSFVSNATSGLLTLAGYPPQNLGDWCAPSGNVLEPGPGMHLSNVITGYFWIRQLEGVAKVARVLGNASAAAGYAARARTARAAYGRLYFDASRGLFRDPTWVPEHGRTVTQTEQALAIALCLDLQDGWGGSEPGTTAPEIVPAVDVARAAAALAADVGARGLDVGMVGVKHVFAALAATGHGATALAALASRAYPGFGYMLDNGEGTLWERWEGGARDLAHSSRNHIMLGSPGQWLFQRVAGIDVGRGGVAFDRVASAPLAAAAAAGSGLAGVDAAVGSPRGAVAVAWRTLPWEPGMCAEAAERNDQGAALHLDCGPGGIIGTIDFASFGTPAGSCTAASALATDPTCDATSSVAVVTSACAGQRQCTLYANASQFGGADPCHGVRKRLVVAATCAGSCQTRFILNATVPVGSTATVTLPGAAVGGADVLTEAGQPIYRAGAFVPGAVAGVKSAQSVNGGLEVVTGGGRYAFALLKCGNGLR
eukprot:g5224.t1